MTQERPIAPVRTTYAGKMKKRRASTVGKDKSDDDSESDNVSDTQTNGAEKTTTSKVKPPSRIPKKMDANTPGGTSMKPPSMANKSGLAHASPNMSAPNPTASPSVSAAGSMKPPSSMHAHKSSIASSRAESQDVASDDDTVSVAESTSSRAPRKRKGEAERVQFFKDDPNCAEVEPNRALCAKCGAWIALHNKRRYVMQHWVTHRKACRGGAPTPSRAAAEASPTVATENGLTEAETEGKAVLERDAKAGEIRPHEAFCTSCAKWIKLDDVARFAPHNWIAHSTNCPGAPSLDKSPPRNDAAREQRHREIQNDPHVLAFTGTIVTCSTTDCQQDIDLGEDLDLSRWEAHKAVCPPPAPTETAPAEPAPAGLGRGQEQEPVPQDVPESPTEAPVEPAAEAPPSPEASPSRKRGRESESEEESQDRAVRQRSESYKPARGPALWHALMKPFRSFVQGFKDGMGSKPAS